MTKQIAVLSSQKTPIIQALSDYFKDKEIKIFQTENILEACEADLCIIDEYKGYVNEKVLDCTQFISIHNSLLPAFDCENPEEKAFEMGVKVSGVTIYYTDSKKIIAQYPVFIDLMTTMNEFKQEIQSVKNKLCPFVAESVIEDKLFSFDMLLKPDRCSGSCSQNCNCQ